MADSDVVMAPADARAGDGGAAGAGGGRRAAAAAYPRRRGAADRALPAAAVAPRPRRARSPADAQPKRKLGTDITNAQEGASQSKKTKKEPKEKVAFEWSAEDMASDVAPSDATIVSVARRQVYRITTAIQATHAPKIKRTAAFSSHAGSDAAEAVKARRSGAAPSAAAGPSRCRRCGVAFLTRKTRRRRRRASWACSQGMLLLLLSALQPLHERSRRRKVRGRLDRRGRLSFGCGEETARAWRGRRGTLIL